MLEFKLTPNSISTLNIWLMALLGMSFLLTVRCLLQFASTRFVLSHKYDRFSKLLLAVLACIQIFTWQLYFYEDSHDTVALWCFAVAIVGGALVWRVSRISPSAHQSFVRTLPMVVAMVSLAEFAGFAQATKHFTGPQPTLRAVDPGILEVNAEFSGITDCGTRIQLFERQITSDAFQEYIAYSQSSFAAMAEKAMLRAQPFVQSNCHGWVFSQGEHIVKGEDVQRILDENKYTLVSQPATNDGLVRGSLNGATMVESKWGVGAIYMHLSDEQPYSQNISYYHTNRPTHNILISSTKPTVEALAEHSKAKAEFKQRM
jgi:hypothetical protein